MNKYYSLVKTPKNEVDLTIFGDITSYPYEELGEVGSYNLSKQLNELGDVDIINVHINSYGGEVSEGLAIYNSLKNHKAKVKTYCDGFACSIASVIFMAGDERIMSNSSLLMIHNAWTCVQGNADELRKQAEDLDIITSASINAYMSKINITEKELKTLLDGETWLTPQLSLEKGFATKIIDDKKSKNANQSVRSKLYQMILNARQEEVKTMEDKLLDILNQFKNEEIDEEEAIKNITSLFEEEEPTTDVEEEVEVEPSNDDEPTEEPTSTDEEDEKDDDEDKKEVKEKNLKFFNALK